MSKIQTKISTLILFSMAILLLTNCNKSDNPVKYSYGTFPDTVINLSGINSAYDDYNSTLYLLGADIPLVFSSNRGSSGGQFDLVSGIISFAFNQETGDFTLESEILNNAFYNQLIKIVNTPGNDFGPYQLYSSLDGYEYLILSSVNSNGNLDFYFTRNYPYSGTSVPSVDGPFPASLLNTASDDAYFSFDWDLDSAYLSSNPEGNFDIYVHPKPLESNIYDWLTRPFEASSKVDGINSPKDDKCPIIYKNMMIFASDREGGFGGFDLYYSLFANGKWGTPVNFGPSINTSANEYRPVIGAHSDFTNQFMIFSSDRAGGKGGFDLYFTGITLSK